MKNHFGLHKDPFSKQFLKETILSVQNVLHFNLKNLLWNGKVSWMLEVLPRTIDANKAHFF